jgi:anti-sigma28 factor (negative regulator of flagellin synthesis)
VEISSLSGRIADASSASATAQANRVQQLGALYSSGRYQVDSAAVSRSIVSQALLAGSMGGD